MRHHSQSLHYFVRPFRKTSMLDMNLNREFSCSSFPVTPAYGYNECEHTSTGKDACWTRIYMQVCMVATAIWTKPISLYEINTICKHKYEYTYSLVLWSRIHVQNLLQSTLRYNTCCVMRVLHQSLSAQWT